MDVNDALANALATKTCRPGMCLQVTRGWLNIPARAYDADDAWDDATRKHPGDRTPPKGAPVFYAGGNHGHIALHLGGGQIRSTDAPSAGLVSTQALTWPETHWGLRYLGWTEDLNGVDIDYLTGDDMPTAKEIADAVWAEALKDEVNGGTMAAGVMLRKTHRNVVALKGSLDVKALAAALAPLLPTGAGASADQIEAALRRVFADAADTT